MPLPPGNARNLGPVAGTGADGAITGIGAADLGEIVQLPDGSFVAVFGDSFGGDKVGTGAHYASVAVPVTFDEMGRPQFGEPLDQDFSTVLPSRLLSDFARRGGPVQSRCSAPARVSANGDELSSLGSDLIARSNRRRLRSLGP